MISIPFVATSDNYGAATTISHQLGKSVSFTIANNPVAYQLGYLDKVGEIHWGEEVPSNPIDGGFSNVAGIRFRSWTPGKPAIIVATLFLESDPTPLGATAFTASLTSSGGQTPGLSSVQVDHNGVAISTEPILNFVDTNSIPWLITDVPGSTQAQLQLAITVDTWAVGPPSSPVDGQIWIATSVPNPTSGNGSRWVFMYDANWVTDVHKWKFIGGDNWFAIGNLGGINWQTLTAIGATGWLYWNNASTIFTAGRAGVYNGFATGGFVQQSAATQVGISLANITQVQGTLGNSRQDVIVGTNAGTGQLLTDMSSENITANAGDQCTFSFSGNGATGVEVVTLRIQPIRIH